MNTQEKTTILIVGDFVILDAKITTTTEVMYEDEYIPISIVLLCALTFVMSEGSASRAWAEPKTLFGESSPLGQGTARSFVVLDDQGQPVSIGIALTEMAISGLPQGPMPSELTLAFLRRLTHGNKTYAV